MRRTTFTSVHESGAQSSLITTDTTLDEQDVGAILLIGADGVTLTLPAVATGLLYQVECNNDGYGIIMEPNNADNIAGFGVTGTDGDLWVLTSATAQKGDKIVLQYQDANGWIVTKTIGTWTQQSD